MQRFTDDQKRMSEAIKLLIELYYILKETNKNSWFTESIVKHIANIFHKTIQNFSPCYYFQGHHSFRYRGKDEKILLKKTNFEDFIEIMEALQDDLQNGMNNCFKVIGGTRKTQIQTEPEKQGRSDCYRNWDQDVICEFIPARPDNANLDQLKAYSDKLSEELNSPPVYYESYQLLFKMESKLWDKMFLEDGDMVSSPGYFNPSISFIKVMKYVLAQYIYLFGAFDRIKMCKQCNKLFFEKKLGAKEFCGSSCRKKFNDLLQPPGKRLCRERQNQWLRYKFKNTINLDRDVQRHLYLVSKDECDMCNNCMESGACHILISKNKKIFSFLERYKRRSKKNIPR